MTNTQLYFAPGVPFFTVVLVSIAGPVSHWATSNELRSELRTGFSDLRADLGARSARIVNRLDTIDTEIRIHPGHRLAVLEARVLDRV